MTKTFTEVIRKIGINPYVKVPDNVLENLFREAKRTKSPIQVRGKLNGQNYKQTLVKYKGIWRLYLNGPMRESTGIDVGDNARVGLEFDPNPRNVPMNPKLKQALSQNKTAKTAFEEYSPSHQKEILRYLNSMKTEASLERNVAKVMRRLLGKKTEGLQALMRQ